MPAVGVSPDAIGSADGRISHPHPRPPPPTTITYPHHPPSPPPCAAAAAPGPKGGKRLSRAEAYQFLWPFISPLSGFVARILDHEGTGKRKPAVAAAAAAVPPTPATPASGDSMRLRHDVLQLLRVAFAAPGNPFVQDKATTGGVGRWGVGMRPAQEAHVGSALTSVLHVQGASLVLFLNRWLQVACHSVCAQL